MGIFIVAWLVALVWVSWPARSKTMPQHETNSDDCWCEPQILQVCPESPGRRCPPSCWRCAGKGLVEPYDEDRVKLIVHRR